MRSLLYQRRNGDSGSITLRYMISSSRLYSGDPGHYRSGIVRVTSCQNCTSALARQEGRPPHKKKTLLPLFLFVHHCVCTAFDLHSNTLILESCSWERQMEIWGSRRADKSRGCQEVDRRRLWAQGWETRNAHFLTGLVAYQQGGWRVGRTLNDYGVR